MRWVLVLLLATSACAPQQRIRSNDDRLDPGVVDRIESASIKTSWSGALKYGTIALGVGGIGVLASNEDHAALGASLLVAAGVQLVVALLLDASADDDLDEIRRGFAGPRPSPVAEPAPPRPTPGKKPTPKPDRSHDERDVREP